MERWALGYQPPPAKVATQPIVLVDLRIVSLFNEVVEEFCAHIGHSMNPTVPLLI